MSIRLDHPASPLEFVEQAEKVLDDARRRARRITQELDALGYGDAPPLCAEASSPHRTTLPMKVLIFDDMEVRHAGFKKLLIGCELTHAYSVAEGIEALLNENFDVAFLDHDMNEAQMAGLDDGEPTGLDVAKHIAQMPEDARPKQVVIHTWNKDGGNRMAAALLGKVQHIVVFPYKPTMPIRF